ncbi:MAG: phosphonoacetaldehyde hydrolase [Planctomycetota bacterium]|nr:MAG: phosphonoacetaldehyde hydrolase [Planctomycetota bacterium]
MSAPARWPYRGPLKAVIFDWAGTVVDYGSRAPVMAILRAFAALDVPVTLDEARGPMGMSKREHLEAMMAVPRIREAWQAVHGEAPGAPAIDRLYHGFLATQAKLLLEHVDLIPGCLEMLAECRARGLKIGSSTGYTQELMEVLAPAIHQQGFKPDALVTASDVPHGRPAPWECLENARRLNVYPMQAIVKVDDTTVGIEAGLNAGMWTVGVAKTGNLIGLGQAEFDALDADERQSRLTAAREVLRSVGAHQVIDSVAELPGALDELDRRLRQGEAPQGGR